MRQPYDPAQLPTVPNDRSDLALALAIHHLQQAQQQMSRAMKYRAELELALYFEIPRLAGIVHAIRAEMVDPHTGHAGRE